MRHVTKRLTLALCAVLLLGPAVSVFAQSAAPTLAGSSSSAAQASANARRLSIDDAVRLALEQNLGIQIERMNPRIQELAIVQARSLWTPSVSTTVTNNSTN